METIAIKQKQEEKVVVDQIHVWQTLIEKTQEEAADQEASIRA